MKLSQKRLDKIIKISDEDIDVSDIPELSQEFWDNAQVVLPTKKVPVSLRLDKHVVTWFKKHGKGYQTHINAVLSAYIKTQGSPPQS